MRAASRSAKRFWVRLKDCLGFRVWGLGLEDWRISCQTLGSCQTSLCPASRFFPPLSLSLSLSLSLCLSLPPCSLSERQLYPGAGFSPHGAKTSDSPEWFRIMGETPLRLLDEQGSPTGVVQIHGSVLELLWTRRLYAMQRSPRLEQRTVRSGTESHMSTPTLSRPTIYLMTP